MKTPSGIGLGLACRKTSARPWKVPAQGTPQGLVLFRLRLETLSNHGNLHRLPNLSLSLHLHSQMTRKSCELKYLASAHISLEQRSWWRRVSWIFTCYRCLSRTFFFFSYDRDGLVLVKHLQSYDFPFSLRLLLLPFFDFLLHRAAYVDCHVRDDRTAAAYWK